MLAFLNLLYTGMENINLFCSCFVFEIKRIMQLSGMQLTGFTCIKKVEINLVYKFERQMLMRRIARNIEL